VTQEAEDRPDVDAHDRAAQVVGPRQPVAQPMRQGQHPLPHRHRREDVVDHVRGAVRHSAPATTRADRPPFTAEGHDPIETTLFAAEAREAAGQAPAAQKLAKLLLDKPRQAFPVAQTGGLRAEGLEVIADHLVHDTLRGNPRLIRRRQGVHAVPGAQRMPVGIPEENGGYAPAGPFGQAISAHVRRTGTRNGCRQASWPAPGGCRRRTRDTLGSARSR